MKNSMIRCCISCILPCGSLDVIRIVHANGRIEEINRMVRAADIMKTYPNHVLKNVDPASSDPNIIVIMPPQAELHPGKIYFLIPVPPPITRRRRRSRNTKLGTTSTRLLSVDIGTNNTSDYNSVEKQLSMNSDRYLTEILSTDKIISTSNQYRRRGRTGIWRPHLESILETPILELFPQPVD